VADEFVVDDLEESRFLVEMAAVDLPTLDHRDRQGGEAADLARPLVLERGRADDQRALDVAHFLQQGGRGNRLDGFAQPHVIRQHGAPPEGQVHGALFLVGVEFRGEDVEVTASAFDLFEKPLLLLLDLGPVLQQCQVFARRLGDDHERTFTRREPFDGGEQGRQGLQWIAAQDAGRIEVTVEHVLHRGRVGDGQRHAHGHVEAIVQVNLRAAWTRDDEFFQPVAKLFTEMEDHAFDVFAGADQIGLVIGAGAGVLQLVQRADLHPVGASADRFDLELAEDRVAALIGNLEDFRPRPCASAFDLFLDVGRHRSFP
jgi:hypothetical protein